MPSPMLHAMLRAATMTAMAAVVLAAPAPAADRDFAAMGPDQTIAAFRVECLYDNEAGMVMGARLRHGPSGMVLDCLRIQSVPQAFMYVNTPPSSDRGEPHTCEHLLLGKGVRGRAVASLEEMSLGTSSAFTMRLRTCYHFHTAAGAETFYDLLEAKLAALVHPDFTDEEIRREVCNMGVAVDPSTGDVHLEEKGTVYNEMVSSFERPWSPLMRQLEPLLYGARHPLALSSGGFPDSIRTMVPGHMREFLADTHRLSNMGMIVTIPDEIALDDCLERLSAILARVEPEARPGADPATAYDRLPSARPAAPGAVRVAEFPHPNPNEPGMILLGWAPRLDLDLGEALLLDLLVGNLAGGETSDLYRRFVDSQTRGMDTGATEILSWTTAYPGHPFFIGLGNVRPDVMTPEKIEAVREVILGELARVADFADGSPELRAYNQRALGRLIESRRSLRKFLNSPPGFGARNLGAAWMEHLDHLATAGGARRSLAMQEPFSAVEQLIASDRNFWRERIAAWQLVTRTPAAVAVKPNPEILARSEAARADRIARFTADLERRYGVESPEAAIAHFREEYDAATAEIDAAAADTALPRFIDQPPLTLDDLLRYEVGEFPGADGAPLVTSIFENLSGATIGMAFRLDVVPESLLVYVPALPTLLADVGVIQDGKPLTYDAMKEAIRREILELTTYFTSDQRTGRTELALRAGGTDIGETERALGWMGEALFAPDWRVENLPRLRDVVDGALARARDRMHEWEEMWVREPSDGYRQQDDPLFLHAQCFLTQEHALHRLRWLLKDPGAAEELAATRGFLMDVADFGEMSDRAGLVALATALADSAAGVDLSPAAGRLVTAAAALPVASREAIAAAARDLRQSLPALPEETLAQDWSYLCAQMAADLAVPPATALAALAQVRNLILRADNLRGFLVASTRTAAELEPSMAALAARLGREPAVRQTYGAQPRVALRAGDRIPELAVAGEKGGPPPTTVGLLNESTRNGVVMNSAPAPSYFETDRASLLNFLASRLYAGGGAHSLFMRTWGAGLAYSNGVGSSESQGRIMYYAERCPDLAQTVRFVVDELENAPADTSLAEYSLAQAFSSDRGAQRYEQRGEAMAADLTDGVTPEVVRDFRTALLDLRSDPDLYGELRARMESVYGKVLPGVGEAGVPAPGAGQSFIIGPEKQFQSYDGYLKGVAGETVRLYRLYPRDFWITRPQTGNAHPRTRI